MQDLGANQVRTAIEVLTGFSLGAESIALFSRVGGGIYTKAADVGADLVGKVEAGIPEDDVRNPATIADNVGDNVGDVAGMGADLFGSYVATILATMVLGQEIKVNDAFGGMSPILLPMVICGLGIVFSIIGTLFVTIKDEKSSVQNALNIGNWASMMLTVIASYFVVMWLLPDGPITLRIDDVHQNGRFCRDRRRNDRRRDHEHRHRILHGDGQKARACRSFSNRRPATRPTSSAALPSV